MRLEKLAVKHIEPREAPSQRHITFAETLQLIMLCLSPTMSVEHSSQLYAEIVRLAYAWRSVGYRRLYERFEASDLFKIVCDFLTDYFQGDYCGPLSLKPEVMQAFLDQRAARYLTTHRCMQCRYMIPKLPDNPYIPAFKNCPMCTGKVENTLLPQPRAGRTDFYKGFATLGASWIAGTKS